MPDLLHRVSPLDSAKNLSKSGLLPWLVIVLTLTFGLSGDVLAARQKTRSNPKARVTRAKPAPTPSAPENIDERLPQDPAIEAEERKLAARTLEEQQNTERDLLARNVVAQTRSNDLLDGFRKTFPFHSQVIALSDREADGSRTLIISEPPPHVRLADILVTIGPDFLLNHFVKKHPIGYDGWVKDVVIAVKGNDEELQAMLSRLNQRLFFTSYKSYTLKLPVHVNAKALDLNLTVTPEETKRWVIDEREQFFPVEGGKPETLTSLTTELSSGVYVSTGRGLIGWWIPKARDIYECRIPARQFALDSDLIIGAVGSRAGILVLGRERIVPIEVLPPLRFETLALLADVQKGQEGALAQSYERLRPFAGGVEDKKDWAPILLSPELRDIEYGSLLNITDQLLKGWSNVGETRYQNFPYPTPPRYPFPKRLRNHLGLRESLTFNWNTKGAGYAVKFGPLTVMALNRTGSLPVSYIPDGMGDPNPAVITAENDGYEYFSTLNDPNLVRVVQYAACYQVFSALGVARSPEVVPADSYPDQLFNSITNQLKTNLRQALDRDPNALIQRTTNAITARMKNVTSEKAELIKKEVARQLYLVAQGSSDEDELGVRHRVLSLFASFEKTPELYAQAVDSRAKGWIHTPVVVMSWNVDAQYEGGHNLDAKVSRLISDERVLLGQVEIDAKGNLRVNPKDLARARNLARIVERDNTLQGAISLRNTDPLARVYAKMELQNALSHAEAISVQPREIALHLPATQPVKPPINKTVISTTEPGPAAQAGWGGEGRLSRPVPAEDSNATVRFRQTNDGRLNLDYNTADGSQTFALRELTHEDAVDAAVRLAIRRAKPGQALEVAFDGIPAHKAQATLRSMEIRMAQVGESIELIGFIRGEKLPSALASTKLYNFGSAKIEASEIRTIATGELQQDVSLRVPEIYNGQSSLIFTSEITFTKSTPQNVISAVIGRVSRTLESMAARWGQLSRSARYNADVRAYNKAIALAERRLKGRSKLDFDVTTKLTVGPQQGLGDAYVYD